MFLIGGMKVFLNDVGTESKVYVRGSMLEVLHPRLEGVPLQLSGGNGKGKQFFMLCQCFKHGRTIAYDNVVIVEKGLGEKLPVVATINHYPVTIPIQLYLCLMNEFIFGHVRILNIMRDISKKHYLCQ
jgi:hypothetical protein